MEYVTLESRAYRELTDKIDRIADFVRQSATTLTPGNKDDVWMDAEELLKTFSISSRTLQRLRHERKVSYSTLRGNGKCIYRRSDIERLLSENLKQPNKNNPA
ncbi:MAG: DNA-binding protein [Tannerellaceae bacterium]|jgi:hypothetical protein|nr:DNA-binding protein [Tannerellaceae bacterium]